MPLSSILPMMCLTALVGLTQNKTVEKKDYSATGQGKFLFYREVRR